MSTAQDVLNHVRHAINPGTDAFSVLNEAIRAIAKRLYFLKSNILHGELSIAIVATDTYGDLPSDFWGLVSYPYFSGYTWRLKPLPGLDVKISFTGDGIPLYYEVKGLKIYLTPSSGGSYTILGDYFAKPTKITATGDTMPFDELFDDVVASYMGAFFAGAGKGAGGTILNPSYLHQEIDLIATKREKKAPFHLSGGINWGVV